MVKGEGYFEELVAMGMLRKKSLCFIGVVFMKFVSRGHNFALARAIYCSRKAVC